MSHWNTAVLPADKASSAAEEQRCICIIQDTTSDSRRKHTHTLPISATTDQLFEIVAKKLKYVKQTFTMTFSKSAPNPDVQPDLFNRVEASQVQTLDDVGFSPGEKTYIQVGPLNGMKPVPSQVPSISEDTVDEATTSATEWSYSKNMSEKDQGSSTDPVPPPPPIPPKLNQVQQNYSRRNAVSEDEKSTSFSESITKAALKIKGDDFIGVDGKGPRLIGLVNQAMTCYLNSLIQTLYMTPEFRNALYEWEYKGEDDNEATTTIPYQLQRLFLALQTSDKQAVETTDLTKSFGWDSSEAWQQHDIQELCRVMFDALEQKFKESAGDSEISDEEKPSDEVEVDGDGERITSGKDEKAANDDNNRNEPEIIKLYEGTMKDYVQCEECKNETSRNDTYLDIPITIRPFGSSVAYGSVMEGLKAFVEPETLNGTNQYFCEKCNKKCDAKKGLKFTSFPYLLTLQLKRFDFDYSTMHRVKLNDRMYFPEKLDLNSFVVEKEKEVAKEADSDKESECSAELGAIDPEPEEEEADSSSRDSGNDDDRLSLKDRRRPVRVSDSEEGSSVDEGIEIESQSGQNGATGGSGLDDGIESGSSTPGAIGGATKNQDWSDLHGTTKPQSKYIYELFSIMIHSGSAVGGHYYAYIKSFDDGQWYCFNDQIVSAISTEDIEKSYGGSGSRSSYSSSFSSSTNAYMLMYRQICPDKNKPFIRTEDLPEHIKRLSKEDEEREIRMQEQKEKEKNMCSIKVYCRHAALTKKDNVAIVDEPFEFHNSMSLRDATEDAYKLLKLEEVGVSLENCRLIKYDHYHQSLDQSLDDEEENQKEPLAKLLGGSRMSYLFDLLMETKEDHGHFDVYKSGGITVKVFPADYHKGCFLDMVVVRLMPDDNVYHLKQVLAKKLHYPIRRIRMAYEKYASDVHLFSSASQTLRDIGVYRTVKVYVDLMNEEECQETEQNTEDPNRKYVSKPKLSIRETRMWTLIDRTANLINVEVFLPEDAPAYELPPSRPITPLILEFPPLSPTDSIPPLIDHSPSSEVKLCPEAPPGSVRSTPSSDEGVGSYDGSSGSNSVPKTAEGSATGSPKDKAQLVECPALFAASETTADETTLFWRSSDSQYFNKDNNGYWRLHDNEQPIASQCDDELPSSSEHLRRNSEEDEGCSPGPPVSFTFSPDFRQELDRKLQAAGFGQSQSPTSSLKCEDGSSSDSGSQTSGEFEIQDSVRLQGDGAADSAGSCSTIDSTGTLCNTTDDAIVQEDTQPIYPYTYQGTNDTDDCTCPYVTPTATKMSVLPGMARPVASVTFSTAADQVIDGRVDKSDAASGFSPSNGFCDCGKSFSTNSEVQDDPDKDSNWDSGPGYLCASCGKLKSGCMSEAQSTSSNKPTLQDPESGEGMDEITPLFNDMGPTEYGAGDSVPDVKPKYIEMTCMNNPSLDVGTSRQRTESSSSVLSDLGYGDQNHVQHSYFCVSSVQTNSEDQKCQVLRAQLDKRTTVGALKQRIQPIIQVPTRDFSIYRVYQSGQETELNSLNENFLLVPDDARLRVKQQRALRKDEHRCKVYHLDLAQDDPVKHVVDWVVKRGLTIKEAQQIVSEELYKECEMKVKPEKIRLRKKYLKTPGKIFLETDEFGRDIIISCNQEIFLEILDKPEEKKSHSQLSVYCRRWRPSTLTLDPIQDVLVDADDNNYHPVDEMKKKLSVLSGLDVCDIQWAKPKGPFPCLTNVLDIHYTLEWDPTFVAYLHCSPVNITEDGSVIFYRDKNEEIKELADKERTELHQQEMARLARARSNTGGTSRGSSNRPYFRKEKALKIYTVGNSSKRKKDNTTAL